MQNSKEFMEEQKTQILGKRKREDREEFYSSLSLKKELPGK